MSLSVDFGTSHTVAVLRGQDGEVGPLLFDGSPLLVSAVSAGVDGVLTVGRDAVYSARLAPQRFEPHPKRRIDDGAVLLGDVEVDVVDVFAAVLRRVGDECLRVCGQIPMTTLTHPATWGPVRRQVLIDAASAAGMSMPRLVAEPVAAADFFARRQATDIPDGSVLVVYDLGGGTFDVTVVRRRQSGFEVLAADGAELGGVDIDQALLTHVGLPHQDDPRWSGLVAPRTVDQRRQRRLFVDDVRSAKERLSRDNHVDVLIPLVEKEAHLTRGELEAIARPFLDRTVRLTQTLIRAVGRTPEDIAGLFLVGGASRMPLAATLLHQAIGVAPTVIEQPETVVANGALPDEKATEEWCREAAETGDARAMFNLGIRLHNRGELVGAEEWFRKAAEAGHSTAMFNLGILLMNRDDSREAERWYRRAADAGHGTAMMNLGVMLRDRGDRGEAEEWFRRSVDAGEVSSMNKLGLMAQDRGDLTVAEEWFCKAVDAGNALAMNNLGLALRDQGELAEAEQWFRKAVDAGVDAAMFNIGLVLVDRGEVVEAEGWYRRAADAGHGTAMFNLGVYSADRGETAEAEGWYRQAADAGEVGAMYNLGVLLADRGEVAEAEDWYRKAADAGSGTAMYNLGTLATKRGELAEAEEWFRRAVEAGDELAVKQLDRLSRKRKAGDGVAKRLWRRFG